MIGHRDSIGAPGASIDGGDRVEPAVPLVVGIGIDEPVWDNSSASRRNATGGWKARSRASSRPQCCRNCGSAGCCRASIASVDVSPMRDWCRELWPAARRTAIGVRREGGAFQWVKRIGDGEALHGNRHNRSVRRSTRSARAEARTGLMRGGTGVGDSKPSLRRLSIYSDEDWNSRSGRSSTGASR